MTIFDNIQDNINPGDDFYKFATGKWLANNPQPAEYTRWCNFTKLDDDNIKRINDIILNPDDSVLSKKLNTLYNIFMNFDRRNSEGLKPVKEYLEKNVYPIATYEEFFTFIAKEHINLLFAIFIDSDMMNSKEHIVTLWQSGLGLYNKEYYISKDPENRKVLEAYKAYQKELLLYYGYGEKEATQRIKKLIKLETKIARVSYSVEDTQEPSLNYHKYNLDDLYQLTGFDWKQYLKDYGYDETTEVNVAQIDPIKKACKLLALTPLEELKDYLELDILTSAVTDLNDDMYNIYFKFLQVLSGAKEQTPKWKRAVNAVNSVCNDIIGQLYIQRYFSEKDKENCKYMVRLMKKSFEDILRHQQWMDWSTQSMAVEKLHWMNVKIGYPDKFDDLSKLPIDENLSYFDNCDKISDFFFEFNKNKKYNKPVDPEEWFMGPQDVNAYYAQDLNEIVFPAAILQYPFYSSESDPAINFGAIGTIIGHEMTHGFDNHGRQYDVDGNLNNWWKDSDIEKFNEYIKYTENHFNDLDVLPGLKCNGSLTLSENLADYGGVKIAYYALKKYIKETNYIDEPEKYNGYTWQQRFFIAYANTEAGTNTEENIRQSNLNNEHAAMHLRINGTLSMFTPWYEAFNIKETDKMYVKPDMRAKIW